MSDPQDRRRRLLEYLYKNKDTLISNVDLDYKLSEDYLELDNLHNEKKVEYLPGPHRLMFYVRITAKGIGEVERQGKNA